MSVEVAAIQDAKCCTLNPRAAAGGSLEATDALGDGAPLPLTKTLLEHH